MPSSDLKKELAEFYAAHELTKLIQNTQELQFVTIWQPYALENLDYAASNRKIRAGRDHAVLRPYIDPDLVLKAMKTKQFENIIVIQWETAEDLVNDWADKKNKEDTASTLVESKWSWRTGAQMAAGIRGG